MRHGAPVVGGSLLVVAVQRSLHVGFDMNSRDCSLFIVLPVGLGQLTIRTVYGVGPGLVICGTETTVSIFPVFLPAIFYLTVAALSIACDTSMEILVN